MGFCAYPINGYFRLVSFQETKLEGIILQRISLRGIGLQGIGLQGIRLRGARLQGVRLQSSAAAGSCGGRGASLPRESERKPSAGLTPHSLRRG